MLDKLIYGITVFKHVNHVLLYYVKKIVVGYYVQHVYVLYIVLHAWQKNKNLTVWKIK